MSSTVDHVPQHAPAFEMSQTYGTTCVEEAFWQFFMRKCDDEKAAMELIKAALFLNKPLYSGFSNATAETLEAVLKMCMGRILGLETDHYNLNRRDYKMVEGYVMSDAEKQELEWFKHNHTQNAVANEGPTSQYSDGTTAERRVLERLEANRTASSSRGQQMEFGEEHFDFSYLIYKNKHEQKTLDWVLDRAMLPFRADPQNADRFSFTNETLDYIGNICQLTQTRLDELKYEATLLKNHDPKLIRPLTDAEKFEFPNIKATINEEENSDWKPKEKEPITLKRARSIDDEDMMDTDDSDEPQPKQQRVMDRPMKQLKRNKYQSNSAVVSNSSAGGNFSPSPELAPTAKVFGNILPPPSTASGNVFGNVALPPSPAKSDDRPFIGMFSP